MAEIKTIEDKISGVLHGDVQKNALSFAAFLRANGLSPDAYDGGEGWPIGGVVGNSIGYMLVNGAAEMPGPWTVWFNSCDFDGVGPADSETKETAWAHASPCGRCHAGWENCGGGDRVIFGKEFGRLCHSPLMFTNPDAKTLEAVEKLALMLLPNA